MKDTDALLEIAIAELQRVSDHINHMYDQVKIKILTFLGAGLAVLTYLYSGGDIFFPKEVYGMIFYAIGLGLTLFGLILLFKALTPITWFYPTELRDMSKLNFKDKTELLEYVRDEYVTTVQNNTASYEKKQILLNTSSYMLIIGAMILIVLNQFGG